MLNTQWVDVLTPPQLNSVRELLLAAREADGWPAATANGPLPSEFSDGPHLLGLVDGDLVGYGHLDEHGDAFGRQVGELIVHPVHRERGYGKALFDALVARSQGMSRGTLRVWSHSNHPAAAVLATKAGFSQVRELLRMGADLRTMPLDPPALPDGVRLRTFEPGQDEPAVVEVNAKAFAWHPEQGALTVEDVLADEQEPWFDPAGFFLATRVVSVPDGSNRPEHSRHAGGQVVGFHWTKVHPPADAQGEPVGEVYVVGVDPDAQGGGLGKALTVAGLEYLKARGLPTVILYVEGDNAPAIAVYSKLGFATESVAVQYSAG